MAYTRVPIRLGEDVFDTGKVARPSKGFDRGHQAFRLLLSSMEVVAFRACATSAMREAENGAEVVEAIRRETGVAIEIIRGREEADLIFSNFSIASLDANRDYLVDVGGGSPN